MKKILLILAFAFSLGDAFAQPGVIRATDMLTNANALGDAQSKTFNEILEMNTRTINWLVSEQESDGVRYISYVDPESFHWYNRKTNNEYNDIINKVIRRILLETVDGIARLTSQAGKPPLEIYFLAGIGGAVSPSNVWVWDPSDLRRIGVLAFTRGSNNQKVRRIVISGRYRPTEEVRLLGNILHGIGHILHEEVLGENSYWGQQSNFHTEPGHRPWPHVGPYTQAISSRHVSGHAQISRSEFVAETFSFFCMGNRGAISRQHEPAVIADYKYLRAPLLKYFESKHHNQ